MLISNIKNILQNQLHLKFLRYLPLSLYAFKPLRLKMFAGEMFK